MDEGPRFGFSTSLTRRIRRLPLEGCKAGKGLVLLMEYCIVLVVALFATYGIVHEIKK